MRIITTPISVAELAAIARALFGNLVKAVVDIEKKSMAIGAELHADEEAALLNTGSKQEHLWGINLYPELIQTEDFIEFDSMINLRPSSGNMTRRVENSVTQQKIRAVVSKLITP